MATPTDPKKIIARNRRARYDYQIEKKFEAGLVLDGWEVKSIRSGHIQISESYVSLRNGEAYLVGSVIQPLNTASTHVVVVENRQRKLLLHVKEISQIFQAVQQRGKTCVPTQIYWRGPYVKCEIAIGTGKHEYDKRRAIRDRELLREKQRSLRRY